MTAVITSDQKTQEYCDAEVDSGSVPCSQRFRKLGPNAGAKDLVARCEDSQKLANQNGGDISEKEDAEARGDAGGVAFDRGRPALAEFCPDAKRRGSVSRGNSVPQRGSQFEMVLVS